jgi:hypothetical protein
MLGKNVQLGQAEPLRWIPPKGTGSDFHSTGSRDLATQQLRTLTGRKSRELRGKREELVAKLGHLPHTEKQTLLTALDAAGRENAQLMARATILQKTLNEKELVMQLLGNKYKNIEMLYNHFVGNLKSKEQTLLEMKNEKVAVEIALAAAGRGKMFADMVIRKLSDDFARISTSYQALPR